MTILEALLSFTLAAGLLTVTPGLDTALVLRTAGAEGAWRALSAALGICCGCLAWGVVVAMGLGVLLTASELAYTLLRWVGAAYLVWLGAGMLLRARDGLPVEVELPDNRVGRGRGWFVRGVLTNLLNPKVGVFYLTFLPQFVPDGVPVSGFIILLAAIHATAGVLWFGTLIVAMQSLSRLLRRPGVVRVLDRLTGCVLIGFGLRLAFEGRR
jgi:threonine/homoserine/homoserine lactone efflux protein